MFDGIRSHHSDKESSKSNLCLTENVSQDVFYDHLSPKKIFEKVSTVVIYPMNLIL